MPRALITGITGQDGSYLAEFLLAKGYEVHGIVRRSSTPNTFRIDHLLTGKTNGKIPLTLHYGDMSDGTGLRAIIEKCQPDEIYNLAAQSHVRISYDQPEYTADVVATGTLRLLEAMHGVMAHTGRVIKFYQAGSSEMFGSSMPPQSELTPFSPRSPYAVSKVAAFHYCKNHREAYKSYIVNGILFNHESPRRGENFVTRKITRGLTRIKLGLQDKLYLGNLSARRDWGFAGDYVEAMWVMLQQAQPDDYVIATGTAHSVQEFLTTASEILDMDWAAVTEIQAEHYRPAEVDIMLGDASKAKRVIGWEPKVNFRQLVEMMVEHDLELAQNELKQNGRSIKS